MTGHDSALLEFCRTVRNLASSPAEQIDYLERLGTAPNCDELGIEFDYAYQLVSGRLSGRVAELSRALDSALDAMSAERGRDLWSTTRLTTAWEWETVRQIARALSNELLALREV